MLKSRCESFKRRNNSGRGQSPDAAGLFVIAEHSEETVLLAALRGDTGDGGGRKEAGRGLGGKQRQAVRRRRGARQSIQHQVRGFVGQEASPWRSRKAPILAPALWRLWPGVARPTGSHETVGG